MSPRAALRLTRLGFSEVYDYAPGKQDWLAFNLPSEGSGDLVGAHLRTDLPTCDLQQPLTEIERPAAADPYGMVVVLDGDVVAGVLDDEALDAPGHVRAGEVMRPGPTTVRPGEERGPMEDRMRQAGVDHILVTSSDARLLGAFRSGGDGEHT